jgi:hypothetical protein
MSVNWTLNPYFRDHIISDLSQRYVIYFNFIFFQEVDGSQLQGEDIGQAVEIGNAATHADENMHPHHVNCFLTWTLNPYFRDHIISDLSQRYVIYFNFIFFQEGDGSQLQGEDIGQVVEIGNAAAHADEDMHHQQVNCY